MTRTTGLILAISLLLPAAALAETVGVRSGDHPGFTRLVVELAPQDDWVFGRVDGGFELRPGRSDVAYALTRVYDKIGHTRIEDVHDLGDGRLQLGVRCDCHAAVEVLADGQVVIDIVTGPAPAPGTGVNAALPPFEEADTGMAEDIAPPPEPAVAAPDDRPVVVSDRAGLPLMLPRVGPLAAGIDSRAEPSPGLRESDPADPARDDPANRGHAAAFPPPGGTGASTPVPPPGTTGAQTDTDQTARIAETEAALLEQVARAAAQGLLDADIDDVPTPAPAPEAAAASLPPVEPPTPAVTQRGHISFETSVDRAAAGPERQSHETDMGDACLDPALFDVASWGDGTGTGAEIGAYRARMITELDRTDSAGLTALVRNYVYITFGAEAKALIRRYPESVERADLLFAMAEIMDDGYATGAHELVDQMICTGATALWATLAQPELRPGMAINRDAVAMAFGGLPAHLRRHLGPRLADRLLASGERETANIVLAAIARASNPATEGLASEFGLLSAQIALEDGKIDEATATLDTVVAAGDAVLPDALLQRVEATLSSGGAVPEDVIILLDGLAFQFRGTDTARDMVDAGIRARISAAAFGAAFDQLDAATAAGLFPAARSAALRDGIYTGMMRDTDDTAFLRLSLPRLAEVAQLAEVPRRGVALRLLDLGLTDAARAALGTSVEMPAARDRLLLARAAVIENRPAAAIGYLAGLEDEPALALRATALDMAQDHAGALRAYEATGDREKMVQMAWRGGLWSEAAALDPGALGQAAQLMTGPADAPGAVLSGGQSAAGSGLDDQPALARAQALIDQSVAARQALGAVLDALAVPSGAVAPDPGPGL
ncbi:MAG: hypothetical protein KDK53_05480 [Maritimibacter sp.]|nr:hypothetical protein [Maritimibacter sp.]